MVSAAVWSVSAQNCSSLHVLQEQDESNQFCYCSVNISISVLWWHCVCCDSTCSLNSHFHVCHKHHIGHVLYRLLISHKILGLIWDLVLSVKCSKVYREMQDTPSCFITGLAEAGSDDAALVLQYLNLNICSS